MSQKRISATWILNKKKNSSVRKTKISLGWGNIWTSSNCDWCETSLNTLLKAMLLSKSLHVSSLVSEIIFCGLFQAWKLFFFFYCGTCFVQNRFILFSVLSIRSSTISHSTLALSQLNLNQYISTSSRHRTSRIDGSTNKIQNPSQNVTGAFPNITHFNLQLFLWSRRLH